MIVNLWAPWCTACKTELPELNAYQASQTSQRLPLYGLLVGEGPPEKLEERTRMQGIKFPSGYAPTSLIEDLYPDGKITLPTTLIFDDQGQLVRRFNRTINAWTSMPAQALTLPQTRTDFLRRADPLMNREDFIGAYESLREAASIDQSHSPTFLKQVEVAKRLGRPDYMISALTRLTEIQPLEIKHWLNLIEQTLPTYGPEDSLKRMK